ncbi:MAG: FIST C-terminal domain-containing protein, partial [Dehalococcoidia bacterium]|nr:FIST C-terminal domain-containing protein [Dehalococcoidia bacterium]
GSVAAALLGGTVKLAFGTAHGFAPISKPRRITKSREHVLVELDGAPAAAVYEEYFGEAGLKQLKGPGARRPQLAYPLGVQADAGARAWLLRNVTAFHPDGSLECTGEMAEGSWLQLMIGNRELALAAARDAVQDALRPMNRAACVLVFDSYARRMLLGPRHAAEELAAIREAADGAPVAGGYGYGELAPGAGRVSVQTGSVLVAAVGS